MKDYILEVCVDSVESAIAAKAGGATRFELCSNLVIGGTTPGYELFAMVKEATGLPIRTLIRPRFGDFLYTDYEYGQMVRDIRHFAAAGADGVVIGSLNADGTLNETQMRGMIEEAGDCGITLHRAFDVCVDPIDTMNKARVLGVDTILTSGQEADCLSGSDLLRQLVELSAGEDAAGYERGHNAADKALSKEGINRAAGMTILAGAGVNSGNIRQIAELTGTHAFHMSGKKVLESGMRYRNERVHMGIEGMSEFTIYRTDEEEIRRAARILQQV